MSEIKDKFTLNREDSILVAKKYLKDSVYRSAHLEGMAVTFPQTEAILENASVHNVPARDIAKVFGLRDAWEYVLDNLDSPLDLKFLEDLHQLIAREDVPWNRLGTFRTENVRISGTSYLPPIPTSEGIHRGISTILSSNSSDTDKAISTMLYIMRSQPFLDGNKRVGTMAANKILIATGHGIFSVPPELKEQFSSLLVEYYETNEPQKLKQFIYNYCLTGL